MIPLICFDCGERIAWCDKDINMEVVILCNKCRTEDKPIVFRNVLAGGSSPIVFEDTETK